MGTAVGQAVAERVWAARCSSWAATTRIIVTRRRRPGPGAPRGRCSARSAPPASAAPPPGGCSCTRAIAAELTQRLVKAYEPIRIGDPLERGRLMGPLIDAARRRRHDGAPSTTIREQGGEILCGGDDRLDRPGLLRRADDRPRPTADMPIACEETFAPILYVLRVRGPRRGDRACTTACPRGCRRRSSPLNLREAERFLAATRQRLRHRQRQHRHLRRRDRRRLRRREGDRRRPRGRLRLLEGLHAPPDLHHQLGHRAAAGPGRAVRRRRVI